MNTEDHRNVFWFLKESKPQNGIQIIYTMYYVVSSTIEVRKCKTDESETEYVIWGDETFDEDLSSICLDEINKNTFQAHGTTIIRDEDYFLYFTTSKRLLGNVVMKLFRHGEEYKFVAI